MHCNIPLLRALALAVWFSIRQSEDENPSEIVIPRRPRWRPRRRAAAPASVPQLGQFEKNPPKIRLEKKMVKTTHYSYACKIWIWRMCDDRKRKLCDLAETCLWKLVKSLDVFLVGFSHLKPQWDGVAGGRVGPVSLSLSPSRLMMSLESSHAVKLRNPRW